MTTSDLVPSDDANANGINVPLPTSRLANRYTIGAGVLALLVAMYSIGNYFGYQHGFKVAYTAEHSHYMFERRRADAFQRRITSQRRCIDKMATSIQPVQDAGFAGLGEMFAAFGLIYRGTVDCNRDAGFGYLTDKQYHRIIPEQN